MPKATFDSDATASGWSRLHIWKSDEHQSALDDLLGEPKDHGRETVRPPHIATLQQWIDLNA